MRQRKLRVNTAARCSTALRRSSRPAGVLIIDVAAPRTIHNTVNAGQPTDPVASMMAVATSPPPPAPRRRASRCDRHPAQHNRISRASAIDPAPAGQQQCHVGVSAAESAAYVHHGVHTTSPVADATTTFIVPAVDRTSAPRSTDPVPIEIRDSSGAEAPVAWLARDAVPSTSASDTRNPAPVPANNPWQVMTVSSAPRPAAG